MDYVELNNIRSTSIKGLLIQSLPPITKPQIRTSIETIDGRDGDIVTKLGYAAYDKPVTVGLYGDFDIDEVIQFFDSEGTVIFSNEQDKYYNYQILNPIDFEKLIRFRTAKVTFHVQPFKFSAVDETVTFTNSLLRLRDYSISNFGVSAVVTNNIITVSGTATGNAELYLPINSLNLKAGSYTLQAGTSGVGESNCSLRLIGYSPIDEDSFGGTALTLENDGSATLEADLTEPKSFNYIWISVENGAEVAFTLNVDVVDNDVDSFTVINRGNTYARPVITVYGSGDIELMVNGEKLFDIALGNDKYITIDSVQMNAYKGDTLKNRSVTGDYSNLLLRYGNNTISWTGLVNRVDISDFTRWI